MLNFAIWAVRNQGQLPTREIWRKQKILDMKKLIILTAFLGVFAGCVNYTGQTPDEFEALLKDGGAVLIDVRRASEYNESHLPVAVNVDVLGPGFLDTVESMYSKNRPLAVYCRSGKRSASAAGILTKAGYKVYKLNGGIIAWKEAGKDVEMDPDVQYGASLLSAGTPAPDFELCDLSGAPVRLSDFRGKTVLLQFWASWCPDCRAEIPQIKEMFAAADPQKVAFVAVSFDKTLEDLARFASENELPGVQLYDPAGKKDSVVADSYGVKWVPTLYVIGPDGKIVLGTVLSDRAAAALQRP